MVVYFIKLDRINTRFTLRRYFNLNIFDQIVTLVSRIIHFFNGDCVFLAIKNARIYPTHSMEDDTTISKTDQEI